MLKTILIIVNALIFLVLSGFHFYWIFGGKKGLSVTVPMKYLPAESDYMKNTKMKVATLIVALGLLACCILILTQGHFVNLTINPDWFNLGCKFLAGIFLIRAIGDFNMVGFFKKTKDQQFSKYDNMLFSPLCLFISVTTFYVAFN